MAKGTGDGQRSASRAVFLYNVMRFGLLAVCLGIGWLATLRGPILIVVALAVSGGISWFVLRPQRIAMGMAVERTVERSRVRLEARTTSEDAYVDQLIAAQQAGSTEGQSVPTAGDQSSS